MPYIEQHAARLEAALSSAVNEAIARQVDDPVRFLGEHLLENADRAVGSPKSTGVAGLDDIVAQAKQAAKAAPNKWSADKTGDQWSTHAWLDNLHTNDMVADTLLAPLRAAAPPAQSPSKSKAADPGLDPDLELAFIRCLGKAGSREQVHSLVAKLLPRLTDALWKGLQELAGAKAATSTELHSKFVDEEGTFALAYGGLSKFYQGLEGVVGPPQPNLMEAMGREHCEQPDSREPFEVTNYGTTTTSELEWWFVADGTDACLPRLGISEWPMEQKLVKTKALRGQCRIAKPPVAFEGQRREINEKLDALDQRPMLVEEFIASRLYTGPLFTKCAARRAAIAAALPLRAVPPRRRMRQPAPRAASHRRCISGRVVTGTTACSAGSAAR
jgi:hypothetical protein